MSRYGTDTEPKGGSDIQISLVDPHIPLKDDAIRVVCISDTHGKMGKALRSIPDGDILIHAGDFTQRGHGDEVDGRMGEG